MCHNLSKTLKYKKKTDEDGKVQHGWFYTLVDLSRFVKKNIINDIEVKDDEDSSCIEE